MSDKIDEILNKLKDLTLLEACSLVSKIFWLIYLIIF